MIVEVDDFGIEWQKSDKVVHKADFDNLIKAYEKLEKIEQVLNTRTRNSVGEIINTIGACEEIEQIVKEV